MSSIDMDFAGFYRIRPKKLGELCALLLAQAQSDGATRIKLHYGINRMFYTIADVDYEMVPMPSPANVDAVRALARMSQMAWGNPGKLSVRFADLEVDFKVEHHMGSNDTDDPYLEITGFTGEAVLAPDGMHTLGPELVENDADG